MRRKHYVIKDINYSVFQNTHTHMQTSHIFKEEYVMCPRRGSMPWQITDRLTDQPNTFCEHF